MSNKIRAVFVGGVMDGKECDIEDKFDTYRFPIIPQLSFKPITLEGGCPKPTSIAVYRRVINEVFWLWRIE